MMDCLRAREIVSEAFDRGVSETPAVEEARRHCRECAACGAFVESLVALNDIPRPKAPESLIDEILRRVSSMDEHRSPIAQAAEEDVAPAAEVVPLPAGPARRDRDWMWWAGRVATGLAAAAMVAVAVGISYEGFRGLNPGSQVDEAPRDPLAQDWGAPATGTDSVSAPAAAVKTAEVSSQARYVAFQGEAYVWLGERDMDSSALTFAGSLSSALETGTPVTREVWRSGSDGNIVFIRVGERYVAFLRVVRNRGGKAYALAADDGLTVFGEWPGLPARFSKPTHPDGFPTFAPAGKDDSGLGIYAPPGSSADDGFAVAPGTSSADPAAGDPNWTWWAPAR